MILKRLYELAEREGLLEDPAFEEQPVPFVIVIGPDGEYLDIEERRGEILLPGRKLGSPPKTKRDKGDLLSVPNAHGNRANSGFARFFADILERVLPVSDEPKSVKSRRTFWEQIGRAADEIDDPALRAVQTFGRRIETDPELVQRVREEIEAKRAGPGERCTFAWYPDGGRAIVQREALRKWFRSFFEAVWGQRQEAGPRGLCQVTGEVGPLPTSHPTKVSGVPGGMAVGVSLISNDKAAFESYALDKAANSGVGYRAAEAYPRALNALVADKPPGLSVFAGKVVFLIWTRDKGDLKDFTQLDRPDPEQVTELIRSPRTGKQDFAAETNDFYCLALSGNSARAVVRDYLESPLPRAQANLVAWFKDLRIVDAFTAESTAAFPLWMLANSTVRDSKDLPPDLPVLLVSAALKGTPLPDSVLAACLRRIRVESGAHQFRPARMALIKLCLNRTYCKGETSMTEALDSHRTHDPAYVCGRLLAFLANCQDPDYFGTSAPILKRYFGSASTAPRAVFPTLLRQNRHHLSKIHDTFPKVAFRLEEELDQLLLLLKDAGSKTPDFPALLPLAAQGRFALGFYHQRADYRQRAEDRKRARAAKADQEPETAGSDQPS